MIEADFAPVMLELAAMLARIKHPQPMLSAIGETERANVQERILSGKVTPWGVAWDPWRPQTAEYRAKKGNAQQGLLWDTGKLVNDIHATVTGNTVEIGSSLPYAIDLQNGTNIMAPREFLGWEPTSMAAIEQAAVLFLSGMQ